MKGQYIINDAIFGPFVTVPGYTVPETGKYHSANEACCDDCAKSGSRCNEKKSNAIGTGLDADQLKRNISDLGKQIVSIQNQLTEKTVKFNDLQAQYVAIEAMHLSNKKYHEKIDPIDQQKRIVYAEIQDLKRRLAEANKQMEDFQKQLSALDQANPELIKATAASDTRTWITIAAIGGGALVIIFGTIWYVRARKKK